MRAPEGEIEPTQIEITSEKDYVLQEHAQQLAMAAIDARRPDERRRRRVDDPPGPAVSLRAEAIGQRPGPGVAPRVNTVRCDSSRAAGREPIQGS